MFSRVERYGQSPPGSTSRDLPLPSSCSGSEDAACLLPTRSQTLRRPPSPRRGFMGSPTRTETSSLESRLAEFDSLSQIPREERLWLAAHGDVARYRTGEVILEGGKPVQLLWVCLSGRVVIDVDRGAGPRRTFEWGPGDVGGMLPYSRMRTTPGTAYVVEDSELLNIDREHFPELTRVCPTFTAHTVHIMLDRARSFNTTDLHDEKMISLGRLAAGLAHELNNPSSATVRAAHLLIEEIVEADSSARALGAVGLTQEQIAEIEKVREICLANPLSGTASLSERLGREERILEWLEARGANPDHAAPLADTAVTIDTLDLLANAVDGSALEAALSWIATGCSTRALAMDIERAARRIHDLVSSVKRFSYMDRPGDTELVDVAAGIADTVSVIGSKAHSKSVELKLDLEPDLPRVRGTGGELNQIWLNLIDNALDAVSESGQVEVRACRELDRVVVRVVDDGHGIPADLLGRIFDPFFTTKQPGEGTGLGLDIARGIARRHGGEIQVESRPGRTEFRVRLPVGTG